MKNQNLSASPETFTYEKATRTPERAIEALQGAAKYFGGKIPTAAYSEYFETFLREFEQTTEIKVIPFIAPDQQPNADGNLSVVAGFVQPERKSD